MIIRRAYKECVGLYRFQKMMRFYSQFIGQGDSCFDVGAHVGERTRVFLALEAKVVCVEPQMRFLSPDWLSPEQLYARLARMDNPLLWGDVYAKLGG